MNHQFKSYMKNLSDIIFYGLFLLLIIACQSRNKFSVDNDEISDSAIHVQKSVKISNQSVQTDSIYKIPDILAIFHGGDYKRIKFFEENTKFPENTESSQDNLVVFLSFVVEQDSTVSNIKILRGINEFYNQEAIRLIKLAKWDPGKVNGKIVRSELAFPVYFKKRNTK